MQNPRGALSGMHGWPGKGGEDEEIKVKEEEGVGEMLVGGESGVRRATYGAEQTGSEIDFSIRDASQLDDLARQLDKAVEAHSNSDMDTSNSDSDDSLSSADSDVAANSEEEAVESTAEDQSEDSKKDIDSALDDDTKWSISTVSTFIREIVEKRHEIVEKQRYFETMAQEQAESAQLVNKEIKGLDIPSSAPKHPYEYEHVRYLDFCSNFLQVPPFPITPPIIALYCIYRTKQGKSFTVVKSWLYRLTRLLENVWHDDPIYSEMDHWRDGWEGLKAFQTEQTDARSRALKALKASTASTPTAPLTPAPSSSRPRSSSKTNRSLAQSTGNDSADSDAGSHNDDFDDNESDTDYNEDGKSRGGSEEDDEDDDEDDDEEQEDRETGESNVKLRQSHEKVTNLKPQPLPRIGQCVDSPLALFKLFAVATIAAFGMSVVRSPSGPGRERIRCSRHHTKYASRPYGCCKCELVVELVNGDWVVTSDSVYEHNHPPAPKRLANPTWMPSVRNEDTREALGLSPFKPTEKKLKLQERDTPSQIVDTDARPQKKPRTLTSSPKMFPPQQSRYRLTPSIESHNPQPSTSSSQPRIVSSSSSSQPIPSQSHTRLAIHNNNVSSQSASSSLSYSRPVSVYDPHSQGPIQSSSSRAFSSQPRQSSHLARPPLSASSPSSHEPDDLSLSTLTSFLCGLHPSLVSLAESLHSTGLDKRSFLCSFLAFETSTLDIYLDEVKKRSNVSVIHLKLLRNKVLEARSNRWR